MTSGDQERLGRVDDEAEEQEPASTTSGAAAEGDYDPAQGSPGPDHPVGEDYPDEAVRYDDPDRPRREEPPQE
jgi:hypothetical protein